MNNTPTIYIENIWSTIIDLPENSYTILHEELSYEVMGASFAIQNAEKQYDEMVYDIEHNPMATINREQFKKCEMLKDWDGRKHLIKKKRNKDNAAVFLSGLISQVFKIIVERFNVVPNIVDLRVRPEKTLDLKWNKKFVPHDYQIKVVEDSIKKSRAIIQVATGGGKTLIVSKIIQELGVSPFIFYVLTKDLMYQAKERLEDYMQGLEVGLIGDGICEIKEINIMTIQTAYKCQEEHKESKKKKEEEFVGLDDEDESLLKEENMDHLKRRAEILDLIKNAKGVYMDEAHHAAARTCQEIIGSSKDAYYIYGGTATPERTDNAELMIEGVFGRKVCDISASFLIDRGVLIAPDIFYFTLKDNKLKSINYQQDYKNNISENQQRNDHIIEVANYMQSKNIPTLILVQRINHGKYLESKIKGSTFIEGKSKKRQESFKDVESKKKNLIITTSLGDEGLDLKRLKCLIMGSGGKSPIKCKQRVGRVIRACPEENKKFAWVFDFNDVGRWVCDHAKERKNILKKEPKFNIKNIDSINELKMKEIF